MLPGLWVLNPLKSHDTISIVPALAKGARTGHPQSMWLHQQTRVGHPAGTISFDRERNRVQDALALNRDGVVSWARRGAV